MKWYYRYYKCILDHNTFYLRLWLGTSLFLLKISTFSQLFVVSCLILYLSFDLQLRHQSFSCSFALCSSCTVHITGLNLMCGPWIISSPTYAIAWYFGTLYHRNSYLTTNWYRCLMWQVSHWYSAEKKVWVFKTYVADNCEVVFRKMAGH